jgi:hypothetical protein
MALRQDRKIDELLFEGHTLLGQGQANEAVLAFGRVLLHDPTHPEARRGLEAARDVVVEAERLLEEERAREADAALKPLHPAPDLARAPLPPEVATTTALPPERRDSAVAGWSRAAFGTACVLLFALMGVAVASTWDSLLNRLARTPAPHSAALPPASSLPAPTSAERALAEARRLLEAGQPAAALAALDGVSRSEPEYPFATQLRHHAERMMTGTAGPSRTATRSAP